MIAERLFAAARCKVPGMSITFINNVWVDSLLESQADQEADHLDSQSGRRRKYQQSLIPLEFPQVFLYMQGTEMCVATEVTDEYGSREVSVARIQEILDALLGPFVWTNRRDSSLRATGLFASREMGRLDSFLKESN